MATEGGKTATFINEANDADIWILPKTEKNLKTTVWGAATAAAVKKGESRSFELCEPGDGSMYIFRGFSILQTISCSKPVIPCG